MVVVRLNAAQWYASPSSNSGDGSLGNPWSLFIALTNPAAAIQPGDTLYLRGGTYVGPGFNSTLSGTSNSYVTVSSYPGEWAVITDGGVHLLQTNLNASSADLHVPLQTYITGGTNWTPGMSIIIGTEIIVYYSYANGWVRGAGGTPIASHAIGDPVMPAADFIFHNRNYVIFRDFEITSTTTNRIVDAEEGTRFNWLGSGLNLQVPGIGNKAINLIVHNVGHPGIGFWDQGAGSEVNGCLIWGNGYYDVNAHYNEPRGAGIYTQNSAGGHPIIKNNIIFDNLTEGIHAYAQSGTVRGYRLTGNMFAANANTEGAVFQMGGGGGPMTNDYAFTNYFGFDSLTFGYTAQSNTDMQCVGNVFADSPMLNINHHLSGIVSNNTFLFDQSRYPGTQVLGFSCPEVNQSVLQFSIDRNTYYFSNLSQYAFGFETADHVGAGYYFTNWVSTTTWDSNSIYQASWPNNFLNVAVQQLDYDANKYHVCVISTSGQTNAMLVLSSYGFNTGDIYRVMDAQNWPTVIASGTYSSGSISLPLTLTALAPIPAVTNFVPQHTNLKMPRLFNAFVLDKSAGTTLNVINLNVETITHP